MSAESHAIQQAAAEFIRDRHLLSAFVTGLLRDVHAAEDVLQEVWVFLSAELEKGTRIQNQAAWCRGVARNLVSLHSECCRPSKTPSTAAFHYCPAASLTRTSPPPTSIPLSACTSR